MLKNANSTPVFACSDENFPSSKSSRHYFVLLLFLLQYETINAHRKCNTFSRLIEAEVLLFITNGKSRGALLRSS